MKNKSILIVGLMTSVMTIGEAGAVCPEYLPYLKLNSILKGEEYEGYHKHFIHPQTTEAFKGRLTPGDPLIFQKWEGSPSNTCDYFNKDKSVHIVMTPSTGKQREE